jgi:signal transduction histidine kinase
MGGDFIIGAETKLQGLLRDIDLQPLFGNAVKAGAEEILLRDTDENVLIRNGNCRKEKSSKFEKAVHFQGEIIGHIVVRGNSSNKNILESIGDLIFDVISLLIKNSMKTLLATEANEDAVDWSYNNVIETDCTYEISENRHRELLSSLETKVQEQIDELKQAQAALLQQGKIVSAEKPASGVSHEINNPLGFVSSNINTLRQCMSKFKAMLLSYRKTFENSGGMGKSEKEEDPGNVKIDHICNDTDEFITENLNSPDRIKQTASELKCFSHFDEGSRINIDINREIDRTLNVLTHEIPADTKIERDYNALPLFNCNPAHLYQIFFNIILNALQTGREKLSLVISTRCVAGWIRINITDNGPGIPDDAIHRIFEPSYTTKDPDRGTGMGLHVSYEAVASYGGSIEVESRAGQGATFSIFLPLTDMEQNNNM